MATFNYKPGLGNAAAYQVSGIPWVSGGIDATAEDPHRIDFPSVTSWITVANDDKIPCKVSFSAAGQASNYFVVPSGSISPRLEVKVTELYLGASTNVSVVAGLTAIATTSIDDSPLSPSGSNWKGSLEALVG